MYATEKRLSHDEELVQELFKQTQDMIDRGAAMILSVEEITKWKGGYYCLTLVGIKGKSKWIRICFDAFLKKEPIFA